MSELKKIDFYGIYPGDPVRHSCNIPGFSEVLLPRGKGREEYFFEIDEKRMIMTIKGKRLEKVVRVKIKKGAYIPVVFIQRKGDYIWVQFE